MLRKEMSRKVSKMNYAECLKKGHEGQEMSMVCLDKECQHNRLACCHCQRQNHQRHFVLPLKQYVTYIYEQRLLNYDSFEQVNQLSFGCTIESLSFNYMFYIDSIENQKIAALQQLSCLKAKFLASIAEVETEVKINANKYIEKIKMMSQMYFQESPDLIDKIANSVDNPARINSIINGYVQNFIAPDLYLLKNNQTVKINPSHETKSIIKNQFQKVVSSLLKKMELLQKSISKFDLSLIAKLSAIIKYQNINFSKSSFLYHWSQTNLPKNFQIVDEQKKIVRVKNNSLNGERIAMMEVRFDYQSKNKYIWAIKINKLIGWIGVGLALRKVMGEVKLAFNFGNIGHGTYLISANGYTWSHSEAVDNSKSQAFNFYTNDIIVMQFNSLTRQLLFKKYNSSSSTSKLVLKIAELTDGEELSPCVNMCSTHDEVQVVSVPHDWE